MTHELSSTPQIDLLNDILKNSVESNVFSDYQKKQIVTLILKSKISTAIVLLSPKSTAASEWNYLCNLQDLHECVLCVDTILPANLQTIAKRIFSLVLLPPLNDWCKQLRDAFLRFVSQPSICPTDFPLKLFFLSTVGIELLIVNEKIIPQKTQKYLLYELFSSPSSITANEIARLCQEANNRNYLLQSLTSATDARHAFLNNPNYRLLSAIIFQDGPSNLAFVLAKDCVLLARQPETIPVSFERMSSLLLMCLPSHADFISPEFCHEWTELAERNGLQEEWLNILNTACNFKECRAIIHKECSEFIKDNHTSRVAILISMKLAFQYQLSQVIPTLKLLLQSKVYDSVLLEALRQSSTLGPVKQLIADDSCLLNNLSKLLDTNISPLDASSIATIIYNMCKFKITKSEHERELNQLRNMAEASKTIDYKEDETAPTERRIQKILEYDILSKLFSAAKHYNSLNGLLAMILVHMANYKLARRKLVQMGALKFLTRQCFIQTQDLNAAFALAKILISVAPHSIFTKAFPSNRAIHPMSKLLSTNSADTEYPILLGKFEVLLALTNLASHDEESRQAIVQECWRELDELIIETNPLIQRATTELINNLSLSPYCLIKFIGDKDSDFENTRLHIVLALSDTEDTPTRLAACGILVQITSVDEGCKKILSLQNDFNYIVRMLTDQDEGIQHRGLVCICNIVYSKDQEIFNKFIKTPKAVETLRTYITKQAALKELQHEALVMIDSRLQGSK